MFLKCERGGTYRERETCKHKIGREIDKERGDRYRVRGERDREEEREMATTAAMAARRTKRIAGRSSKYLEEALYLRLFKEGSSEANVKRELVSFLKSRKRVFKWEVGVSLRKLRSRGRHRAALKLSEVMSKRGMNPTTSDHAIHLDLIAKSRGTAAAEEYFINLPENSKNHLTYGALLNCYCKELMVDKAEALMERMKEFKFNASAMSYNSLMTLHTKTNHPEKIPGIIQEMKAADVMPDRYTYNVWMRALAAMGDIPGVDRVIEEMKRDGRIDPDWTTYSNLASIYVEAGLIQKAENALKDLENLNKTKDLSAFQFLITLYGRTGNLVEVHRIWRSLKLAYRKMANISYLNMIQVLINLEDIPAAETCFKEWESSNPTYDIRVVNALLKGYIKKGRIDDAEKLKKRAKTKGGRLNAKSWEIFMDYYLDQGEMDRALWCVDRAIKKGRSQGREWAPPELAVKSLMAHFEEKKDVDSAEKLVGIVKSVKEQNQLQEFGLLESLIGVYAAAGRTSPGMRHRLKMEGIKIGDEVEKLLNVVCPE